MSDKKETVHPLRHVAIIMDGNNRWAKQRGLGGVAGHEAGTKRFHEVMVAAKERKLEVVTLFAFSSENWKRPELEVRGLMTIFAAFLKRERKFMVQEKVRLKIVGDPSRLSPRLQKLIVDVERETARGSEILLNVCVDYGGRWDILQGVKKVAADVRQGRVRPENLTEEAFAKYLCFDGIPEPDLCIRTAGEQRISNFLLWHLAYSEFYFADCYWPDFDSAAFHAAADNYYNRQRRFGARAETLPANEGVGDA